MNSARIRAALAGVSLLGAMGVASTASAHDQDGSLGAANNAVDVWQVSCDTGTEYLVLKVRAIGGGPAVTATVLKGAGALARTDGNGADNKFSGEGKLFQGSGPYQVLIGKPGKKGVRNYALDYHCWGGNTHTGTNAVLLQNQ